MYDGDSVQVMETKVSCLCTQNSSAFMLLQLLQQQQLQQQLYIHPGECNEITMCKHTCTHTLLV